MAAFVARDRSDSLKGLESDSARRLRAKLDKLTLSNEAIWEREHARPSVPAPWIIKGPYLALCFILDNVFDGRPLARLWFLETVARIPYQSYTVMLQLYESLGWWRLGAQAQRIHFAEAWNELHHLYIMESLGGDREWRDRFFAGHASFLYFFTLCGAWLVSPTLSYNFSELIEAHAVDTYGQFVDENEELLRSMPGACRLAMQAAVAAAAASYSDAPAAATQRRASRSSTSQLTCTCTMSFRRGRQRGSAARASRHCTTSSLVRGRPVSWRCC